MLAVAEDVLPASTQGWIALLVQGGAIGILGYHLLISLPKMIEKMTASMTNVMQLFQVAQTTQEERCERRAAADRDGFNKRSASMVAELTAFRDSLPREIKASLDPLAEEMKAQTKVIQLQTSCTKEQTEAINEMNRKISNWPSDSDKICKAESALREAGFDPAVIQRLPMILERLAIRRKKKENGA